MSAVADTSPLNYLVQIDEIRLLPELFGRVLLPSAVLQELKHEHTSRKVRDWVANPPPWVELSSVGPTIDEGLLGLDLGEREAIQLALDLGIGTVLLDETDGRREAELLGLEARGTLGILERGARLGKTDFRRALGRLEKTNFRISAKVKAAFLLRNP